MAEFIEMSISMPTAKNYIMVMVQTDHVDSVYRTFTETKRTSSKQLRKLLSNNKKFTFERVEWVILCPNGGPLRVSPNGSSVNAIHLLLCNPFTVVQ